MSGGHFNYDQYKISSIVSEIRYLIATNDDTTLDLYGYRQGRFYNAKTIDRFKEAITALRIAEVYATRIDWLVSDDDGEDNFITRLEEDLKRVQTTDTYN